MKSIIKYLKNYKKQAVLAPLFKLLEAVFELLVPLVMTSIIDIGIAGSDKNYIISRGLLLVGMGAVGLVCAITAQYFSAQAASGFATALRDDLFAHIMAMSKEDTDRYGSATLLTRLTNDTAQMQNGVNMFFRLVLRSPMIVFGALIMAWLISPAMGRLFLAVIAVLAVIVVLIMSNTVGRYKTIQQKLDRLTTIVAQNLSGVRVIRAFCKQTDQQQVFESASTDLAKSQISTGRLAGLMNPLTYVFVNLGLIAVLQQGGLAVSSGALTQGQIVALVNYISQILVELVKLANLIILLAKAVACGRRVDEIFAVPVAQSQGPLNAVKAEANIEFKKVTFTYPSASKPALKNISFKIKSGQTVGIIGGTGCGKSTIAALLLRFYDADSGRILIGGHDIREYDVNSLRQTVSIVSQNPRLFAGTVRSNLLWGKSDASESELHKALQTAQADSIITAKNGLDAPVEQGGRNFSGGQKQRLAIARTLVRNASITILDDASSALDFATDAALRQALARQYAANTLLLISQRVNTIRQADLILVIDKGCLVGAGTHSQLWLNCQVYQEICLSQLSYQEAAA